MATNPDLTDGASQGLSGPVVTDLVTRARNGDKQAWDALVERYASLIWSICPKKSPVPGQQQPGGPVPRRRCGRPRSRSWSCGTDVTRSRAVADG